MSNIKMGLTIEEAAAECMDIGRNTMRKLVDWANFPSSKSAEKRLSAGIL